MLPIVSEKTRDIPEHTKGLDGTGCFNLALVGGFPAKLIEDSCHPLLGCLIVHCIHRTYRSRDVSLFRARTHPQGMAGKGLDQNISASLPARVNGNLTGAYFLFRPLLPVKAGEEKIFASPVSNSI